jgi:hypothetical protein
LLDCGVAAGSVVLGLLDIALALMLPAILLRENQTEEDTLTKKEYVMFCVTHVCGGVWSIMAKCVSST